MIDLVWLSRAMGGHAQPPPGRGRLDLASPWPRGADVLAL